MFKRSPVYLTLVLSLLPYITCYEVKDLPKNVVVLRPNIDLCSEYFQYQLISEFINGKLTLPHLEIGDTVEMEFIVTNGNVHSGGIFLPDGSSQDVIKRLQKKQPISYYVGFPVMEDVPELFRVLINDKELCFGDKGLTGNHLIYRVRHTPTIKNGFIHVFTSNINMPLFNEATNEPCGLVDEEMPINEGTPLIFGGKLINRGEYPWLVAIYMKGSRSLSFICGGSLVTSKHILSAAHCFQYISFNPKKITTMLGRHNLTNSLEDGYITRDIESIISHPDYSYELGFSDADLAILVMKEHVSFTKFIKPICLWSESADGSLIVNQTGVVVGWGRDENNNEVSSVPKKVSIQIVSAEVCLRSSIAFNAITSPRTLCGGTRNDSGPCEGDSGGALMINRHGSWMVRGVTSLGLIEDGRCKLDEYTVYCDIARHMPWLQNNTKQQEPPETESLEDICGISSLETRFEHPWLAAIYKHFPTGDFFVCTGSMVSTRSVLLPDGCFKEPGFLQLRRIRVYLGRYDLSNMNGKGAVSRKAESLIFFRENSGTYVLVGNVALLQMKDPVSFTQYIRPICLWSAPRDESQFLEQNITLSGWKMSDVLKGISTVPKSMNENYFFSTNCFLNTTCIVLSTAGINATDRIRMTKRNGRWSLVGGCLYYSYNFDKKEKAVHCTYDFNDMAETMSWIRRNMLS